MERYLPIVGTAHDSGSGPRPNSTKAVTLMSLVGVHMVLGANVRNSAHGKGHEEGGSAYTKAGSSLRSPLEILEHLPPKPESAYFTTLCSHLHL